MQSKITTGKIGEELAESFLIKQGCEIIEKNYRTKYGEIDIIARDKDCMCFVEVRSATDESSGTPEESVNKKKQCQIAKMALSYIQRYRLEDTDARFDVVCIQDVGSPSPKIRFIKNAFELDTRYKY